VFSGVVDGVRSLVAGGDGGACGLAPTVTAVTAMAAALSMVDAALSSVAADLSKDAAAATAMLFEAAVADLSEEEAVTTVLLEAAAATYPAVPLCSPIF